jgi:GNAT superfamily N-acetyltransferase
MLISIRRLTESELTKADRIFRLAFGTFKGHPNPETYGGQITYMKRWYTDPTAAFGAEVDGQLVGSNFAIHWGSFGLFGPLTVHPDFWGKGVGQRLIEPAIASFTQWEIRHAGFLTFSNSPLHLGLYQKFGFYPGFLIALMSKSVKLTQPKLQALRYSEASPEKRSEYLESSYELTDAIYSGLDVRSEICAVEAHSLGDTILLWDDIGLMGLAVCHYGSGTEADSDTCYVKFGAVRSGLKAEQFFEQLLRECEILSAIAGTSRLVAGVNTGRHEAYRQMLGQGFLIERLGVAMHKPNELAYNRPDVYVIDDWR